MGKASRRKHANEQQRLYFDIKDDARSTADRARARTTLDALQQKLVDDALREDGELKAEVAHDCLYSLGS
jgi:hypothetical protein